MYQLCSLIICYLSQLCESDCVNATDSSWRACAEGAAAPHQTSKLSPNAALVSLPPQLHSLLNKSAKKPQMPRGQVLYTPCLLLWSHLSSKAAALSLLSGICANHDAVKLMLKESSGCEKMRSEEWNKSGEGGVYSYIPEESNSGGKFIWTEAHPPSHPQSLLALPLAMHIKCMTRSEEEF